METNDVNKNIVNAYFYLLKNMGADTKLELISRLSESMKSNVQKKESSLQLLTGDFIPEKSADELIKEIKDSRTFNRKTEKF